MVPETGPALDVDPATEQLVQDLRRALRSDDPLDLLAMISSIQHFFGTGPVVDGQELPALDVFVDTLIGVDLAETTAALHVFAALATEADVHERIASALATRRQPMPVWLRDLSETRVTRAVEMSEALGDGDDVLLGITWADGREATYLVYIDHNAGTLVKDAFPSPSPISVVAAQLEEISQDQAGVLFEDLELGEARARVEEAIDAAEELDDPFETDTWPLGRPMVRWLLTLMPEQPLRVAPDSYARETAASIELDELLDDFVHSTEAAGLQLDPPLGTVDSVCLLAVVGFAASQDSRDPLRWSPTRIEILFDQWLPETLVDLTVTRRLPHVARAYISWSLRRREMPDAALRETLAAVDEWAPEFVTIATSREAMTLRRAVEAYERLVGLEGLLGITILEDPKAGTWDAVVATQASFDGEVLQRLSTAVGGHDVLRELSLDPLPDEPFDWAPIPDDARPEVTAVLDLIEGFVDGVSGATTSTAANGGAAGGAAGEGEDRALDEGADLFGVEYRTACRRYLSRVAAGEPDLFCKGRRADHVAAAVCWTIGKANDVVAAPGGRGLKAGELMKRFGLTGSPSTVAMRLAVAFGAPNFTAYAPSLGTTALLTSQRRRELSEARDRILARSPSAAQFST